MKIQHFIGLFFTVIGTLAYLNAYEPLGIFWIVCGAITINKKNL